ncbi:MAG: PIN domain-containing protein [Reyranella sp.]|uniref:PIN domain-containing protein n=1 Tax=Reyranella sp. TaxID=1929291 RepID=UPI003D10B1EB
MKYVLDTSVLCDFARGEPAVMARLRREAPPQLSASVITEMEVEYGLARNPGLALLVREAMRALLGAVSVLPFEREDARVAAQLRASLNTGYAHRSLRRAAGGMRLAARTRDRDAQCAGVRSDRRARARGLA